MALDSNNKTSSKAEHKCQENYLPVGGDDGCLACVEEDAAGAKRILDKLRANGTIPPAPTQTVSEAAEAYARAQWAEGHEHNALETNDAPAFLAGVEWQTKQTDRDALTLQDNLGAKLHSTMDAEVWTQEFMKLWGSCLKAPLDHDLMRTWLANAIMCGWDIAHQRMSEKAPADYHPDLVQRNKAVEAALEAIDWDIREMRVRGVIDMPEMIRALKVISDALAVARPVTSEGDKNG